MPDDVPAAGLRGRDLVGLGGLLVGAVVGGMLLGLLADHAFDSRRSVVLVGVAVGVVAGCLGFALRVRNALRG